MGGYGSGGWNSSGRLTTSDAFCLDVSNLNKAGALVPGWYGGWQWTRDGEQVAYIQLRADEGSIVLQYRSRINGGDWTGHTELVPISWSPCRFGGTRPYLHCPVCHRRVLKLYGVVRYLCRTCQNLTYQSRRESPVDRAFRRADGIRVRLGGERGIANLFPMKPKGMHWQTYEKLRLKADQAEDEIDAYTMRRFGCGFPY